MEKETIIKGFKGYDKDLICRKGESNEQQYEIGKEYEQESAEACKTGYHFCENPLDIFNYYPAGTSRFTEVEGSGKISKDNSDSKVSTSKLKIGLELKLSDIIDLGVKYIFSKTTLANDNINKEEKKKASNSGSRGAASNSGSRGAASNSGYRGAASNSGYRGAASNSGDSGAASNSGYSGAASNSGDSGAASNSGDSGAASNSGYRGAASNSGIRGAAFTIGNYSSSETNAVESVAVAVGYENKAKANKGSWIVLAERNDDFEILNIVSKKVDGKKIKENTFYKLENNELIEC